MLIVPIEEAQPGMKLVAPVANPDHPDQELLRPGYVLEAEVITRLTQMQIPYVLVDYPGLEDLDKHFAAFLSPARQLLYGQLRKSIEASQKNTKPCVRYSDYYDTMRDLVRTLLEQGRNPVFLDQMSRISSDAVGHAMSVAHLALLMGIKLESYLIEERKRLPPNRAKDIVNLGIAGMLHDLGKSTLPESVRHCSEIDPPADPAELALWQEHPQRGYEMIREDVEPSAASAVLQHHQHFDGTGFPLLEAGAEQRNVEGKKIHIFARILRAADLYDRIATRDPKSRRSNLIVLHHIRTQYASWLDPEVLRALAATSPPFPPGMRVQLDDATQAMVLRVEPEDPYHPIVRRIAPGTWTLKGEPLDLRMAGMPSITVGRAVFKRPAAAA